jgi:predicted permease
VNDTLNNLLLPISLFLLGFLFKKGKLLKKEDGDRFLRVVFYLGLPSLVFLTDSSIKLSADLFYIPFIPIIFTLCMFYSSLVIGPLLSLKRRSLGVFLISTMISNVGFTLPFIRAVYGNTSLAPYFLFDFGGGLMVFTFVYFVASKYGAGKSEKNMVVQKILLAPPLWAMGLGLLCNFMQWSPPLLVSNILQVNSNLVTPLLMLSLGIYFEMKVVKPLPTITAVIIGTFLGFTIGVMLALLFHLQSLTKIIVIICCAAPAGYNTLTFSSLENLDKEFAASVVSLSVLIGIFFVPFLILFLNWVT